LAILVLGMMPSVFMPLWKPESLQQRTACPHCDKRPL
jgi:hypothetical protein